MEALHRWEALSARFEGRLVLDNPQASRIGDARRLTERYSFNAYQVDFRLHLAAAAAGLTG
jgi:hypothetical protein